MNVPTPGSCLSMALSKPDASATDVRVGRSPVASEKDLT